MRIVLVEDDPIQLRLLRSRLEHEGHSVDAYASAGAAWKALEEEPARMLITDWMMPEFDGLSLVRKIRAAEFPRYTYVIVLTAREGTEDLVYGLEAGADDYVRKPVDFRELRARIQIGQRVIRLEDELRRKHVELERLVAHDPLTGLNNRRAITEQAEAEIQRALRRGGPLSVALLDIDHFKLVNDERGHASGDDVLRTLAELIVANVRPYDWVGRWGGEEFLIVMPGVPPPAAMEVTDRVRRAVGARMIPLRDGTTVGVRLSGGVATLGPGCTDLESLLREADAALYCAKANGRDRICRAGEHDHARLRSA